MRGAGVHKGTTLPAGTVIDNPDAYRLVQMGVAVPVDDECRVRAGMTPEQLTAANIAYQATVNGIQPEDIAAFRAGAITGYTPDGEPLPGDGAPESEITDEDGHATAKNETNT
jgi:hypothetical protein